MGCGASSLKGDGAPAINAEPAERPARKINTNFASVDYDSGAQNRRMTEYAPHETNKASKRASKEVKPTTSGFSNESEPGRDQPVTTNGIQDFNDDNTGDATQTQYPHESAAAQNRLPSSGVNHELEPGSNNEFATSNDASNYGIEDGTKKDRKKSWLGQKFQDYQGKKSGRDSTISDDDLQKHTGMNREEFNEYSQNTDGVGPRQKAGNLSDTGPVGYVGS